MKTISRPMKPGTMHTEEDVQRLREKVGRTHKNDYQDAGGLKMGKWYKGNSNKPRIVRTKPPSLSEQMTAKVDGGKTLMHALVSGDWYVKDENMQRPEKMDRSLRLKSKDRNQIKDELGIPAMWRIIQGEFTENTGRREYSKPPNFVQRNAMRVMAKSPLNQSRQTPAETIYDAKPRATRSGGWSRGQNMQASSAIKKIRELRPNQSRGGAEMELLSLFDDPAMRSKVRSMMDRAPKDEREAFAAMLKPMLRGSGAVTAESPVQRQPQSPEEGGPGQLPHVQYEAVHQPQPSAKQPRGTSRVETLQTGRPPTIQQPKIVANGKTAGEVLKEDFERALYCKHKFLWQAFRRWDEDHEGSLSLEEVKRACDHLNLHASDEEVEEMFLYLDRDKDGVLSYEDFACNLRPNSLEERDMFYVSDRIGAPKLNEPVLYQSDSAGVDVRPSTAMSSMSYAGLPPRASTPSADQLHSYRAPSPSRALPRTSARSRVGSGGLFESDVVRARPGTQAGAGARTPQRFLPPSEAARPRTSGSVGGMSARPPPHSQQPADLFLLPPAEAQRRTVYERLDMSKPGTPASVRGSYTMDESEWAASGALRTGRALRPMSAGPSRPPSSR